MQTARRNLVDAELVQQFRQIVGEAHVLLDTTSLDAYGHDETEELHYRPELVLKPRSAEEIAAVMRICNERRIPVTPRGAGTGLSGGALPQLGGVLISMERMNTILRIDEANLQVMTEPGVITEVLQDAVRQKGLFYPPDPSSRGSCFIGGNIAENSGGPKAVKYGVVRDYVLNLELVLPTGEIIWTGANVLKNSTGYNLTQLVVGSEGTLGIVTKIVLKLIPLPKFDLLLLAPFSSLEKAGEAVGAIFRAGHVPSGLELVEIDALRISSRFTDSVLPLSGDIEAHLLVEVDGSHMEALLAEIEAIAALLTEHGAGDVFFADDAQQKAELWKLRRRVAEAVKTEGYTIEEDTVVPRAALPALIRGVRQLGNQYGFHAVCYGHAGDGNLHIRIRKEGVSNSQDDPEVIAALRALFMLVRDLGGTISGEHGIGLIQKGYLDIVFSEVQLNLMRSIKKAFDPNNILNAGKIFDQA
ncbi:MAG: FAD-linked oxidase C-terminal domain-containing protein [Bacteroidota bacterium]|nr:FAD-linked oxidase C-terminal domain-containing protein [Bacteroidota bacterium]MDP4215160.1 FAD-linked oxidase C-terminal domain-containing protein [Bacteroidota bacterium]MDP4248124.1 FAD-linked oxidase C-terminal domain-containing protein [Bacteroidota bacterium]MDP4254597.1 FAD-linked oxidase C-terminal domain-containing protein [Bacteroidota bacterium]MDP4258728.1 FAD-linked oxidase C-terminal domain-containing protein [Bacteroidota bacterium]